MKPVLRNNPPDWPRHLHPLVPAARNATLLSQYRRTAALDVHQDDAYTAVHGRWPLCSARGRSSALWVDELSEAGGDRRQPRSAGSWWRCSTRVVDVVVVGAGDRRAARDREWVVGCGGSPNSAAATSTSIIRRDGPDPTPTQLRPAATPNDIITEGRSCVVGEGHSRYRTPNTLSKACGSGLPARTGITDVSNSAVSTHTLSCRQMPPGPRMPSSEA